jgi:hypothetical protein
MHPGAQRVFFVSPFDVSCDAAFRLCDLNFPSCASMQVLSKVIVCLVADREMELGLLKAKLEALRAHLSGPLALVFQTSPT